jgi:hypothetical protein
MSNVLLSLLLGFGAAIWVYRTFARRATGGDFVKTLMPAVLSGILVFFVVLTILGKVL